MFLFTIHRLCHIVKFSPAAAAPIVPPGMVPGVGPGAAVPGVGPRMVPPVGPGAAPIPGIGLARGVFSLFNAVGIAAEIAANATPEEFDPNSEVNKKKLNEFWDTYFGWTGLNNDRTRKKPAYSEREETKSSPEPKSEAIIPPATPRMAEGGLVERSGGTTPKLI
jgi:hypothetical protein